MTKKRNRVLSLVLAVALMLSQAIGTAFALEEVIEEGALVEAITEDIVPTDTTEQKPKAVARETEQVVETLTFVSGTPSVDKLASQGYYWDGTTLHLDGLNMKTPNSIGIDLPKDRTVTIDATGSNNIVVESDPATDVCGISAGHLKIEGSGNLGVTVTTGRTGSVSNVCNNFIGISIDGADGGITEISGVNVHVSANNAKDSNIAVKMTNGTLKILGGGNLYANSRDSTHKNGTGIYAPNSSIQMGIDSSDPDDRGRLTAMGDVAAINTSQGVTPLQVGMVFLDATNSDGHYKKEATPPPSGTGYWVNDAGHKYVEVADGKPVYIITRLDGSLHPLPNKVFTLRQDGEIVFRGSYAVDTNEFTFNYVSDGEYDVYDEDGGFFTGKHFNLPAEVKKATVDVFYHSVTFAVVDAGDASGSTISATSSGGPVASGGAAYKDRPLIITARGAGAGSYTYSWSGDGTEGVTTASLTIDPVTGPVSVTCTVIGGAAPPADPEPGDSGDTPAVDPAPTPAPTDTAGPEATATPLPVPTAQIPVEIAAPVEAAVNQDGQLDVSLDASEADALIEKAQAVAAQEGATAGEIEIMLNVTAAPGVNAQSSQFHLTAEVLQKFIAAGVTKITVATDEFSYTFEPGTLPTTGGGATIVAVPSQAPEAAKEQVGDRPVWFVTLQYASNMSKKSAVTGENLRFMAKYTPKKGETRGKLCVVRIDEDGQTTPVKDSYYRDGYMVWIGQVNNTYGVGYMPHEARYSDIGAHWAQHGMDYAIARGLVSGLKEGKYEPDKRMLRSEISAAFAELLGIQEIPFEKPSASLSRQALADYIVECFTAAGEPLPELRKAQKFSDTASKNITVVQKAGLMTYHTGNKFMPSKSVLRGEFAEILRRAASLATNPKSVYGWAHSDSGAKQYYETNGKFVTGLRTLGRVTYYFDKTGNMLTGLQRVDGSIYYFSAAKGMVTDCWREVDGAWYHFGKDGKMAKNTTIDGHEIGPDGKRK